MAEQPFLNWRERELSYGPLSSPNSWSPRNISITFTSRNLWRKWWSLCKAGILRPGFVPVSPKHLKQGLHCCRRWRERGTSRGQLNLFWIWGPGEAEVCPSVRNVGGEWGCWRWWALVQHCEGDCTITPMCQVQAWLSKSSQTNPFGISVLLSPSARCAVKKKG